MDIVQIISSGLIVIFLVQQLKRWIVSDFLPLVALGLGIIVQVINDLALAPVDTEITAALVWTSIVVGAGVGMAAAGTYDLAGRTGQVPPAQILVDDMLLPGSIDPQADGGEADVPGTHSGL